MNTLERATRDVHRYTSKGGFHVEITFTAPGGATAKVSGLAAKHHLGIDADGLTINSKTAHVSVSEQEFINAGYVIRDASGEVDFKKHLVFYKDSTGLEKKYTVSEPFADETVGLITMILNDYE